MLVLLAQLKDWSNDPTTKDCLIDGVPTLKCLEPIFNNMLFISSSLVILALFLMFVTGSYQYLTSMGNADKIKKAKGTFTYAIIGLILYLSAYLILKTIDFLFLGNQNRIFQFSLPGP